MTVEEIIEELNGYGFTDTITVDKVTVINNVIWDIDSREAWPHLEETLTLTFNGSSAVPSNWPADFRAALSVIDTGTGRSLNPERVETVEKTYPTLLSEVGEPFAYYFVGGEMNVVRIPGSGVTLRLRYLKKQTEVTSSSVEADILLPKEQHEAIVFGCLERLYDKEDDPELAARFEQHFETKLQTMRQQLLMQQYDRPQRIHVVDADDWDY